MSDHNQHKNILSKFKNIIWLVYNISVVFRKRNLVTGIPAFDQWLTQTTFTRYQHTLKTEKNVTDRPPFHTKMAHFYQQILIFFASRFWFFLPADFDFFCQQILNFFASRFWFFLPADSFTIFPWLIEYSIRQKLIHYTNNWMNTHPYQAITNPKLSLVKGS